VEYFIQQVVNGLTLGSIYGLIAIGYTMVYGIIGMINFAHGDVFMIGAFIGLIVFLVLATLFHSIPVAVALLIMVIVAMLRVELDNRAHRLSAAARLVPARAVDHRPSKACRPPDFLRLRWSAWAKAYPCLRCQYAGSSPWTVGSCRVAS
jgi:hypothetical protein